MSQEAADPKYRVIRVEKGVKAYKDLREKLKEILRKRFQQMKKAEQVEKTEKTKQTEQKQDVHKIDLLLGSTRAMAKRLADLLEALEYEIASLRQHVSDHPSKYVPSPSPSPSSSYDPRTTHPSTLPVQQEQEQHEEQEEQEEQDTSSSDNIFNALLMQAARAKKGSDTSEEAEIVSMAWATATLNELDLLQDELDRYPLLNGMEKLLD